MGRHFTKTTITAVIFLTSFGVFNNQANASTLFIGRYGSFVRNINSVGFIPQSKLSKQIINGLNTDLINLKKNQIENEYLLNKIDLLGSAEPLKEQIEQDYISFQDLSIEEQPEAKQQQENQLKGIANPDELNRNIENRYKNIIEPDTEQISLFEANKLLKDQLSEDELSGPSTDVLNRDTTKEEDYLLPKSLNTGIILAIGGIGFIFFIPVLCAFTSVESTRVLSVLGDRFGKPKVPDSAVTLHNKNLKQLSNLAKKAERINDEKFGNKEFLLYVNLRNKIAKGEKEYALICQSIKYLEVAIVAQSSYLKIEQTELRYRSRKQQEFYDCVIEHITEDIDKDVFYDLVKRKLAEIIPLVNSEEGRNALKCYVKEVHKISQHNLGLKLLSVFKKYDLGDFTILKKVSDIVERVNAQDVLSEKNLTILILENYEILEKLAPIIEIPEENINPETFAKILQYMGLVRRYEKSFQQFQDLIKILTKWEKPFKSLKLIREQYPNLKYRTPKEFSEKIQGLNLYQKHEEYLRKTEK